MPPVDDVIDEAHDAGAAGEIAEGHRHEIAQYVGDTDVGVEENSERDEIHIGHAVFETRRDESGDREDDGQDLVGDRPASHREPDREADEDIAQDAAEERFAEGQRHLRRGDGDRRPADRTVLLTVDEATYAGGTMGEEHPDAWYGPYAAGRTWYTSLGHATEAYDDPTFRAHLRGGLLSLLEPRQPYRPG